MDKAALESSSDHTSGSGKKAKKGKVGRKETSTDEPINASNSESASDSVIRGSGSSLSKEKSRDKDLRDSGKEVKEHRVILSPLITEPKVPLGMLYVTFRDGKLNQKPKGLDSTLVKVCAGAIVEGHEVKTRACNGISQKWDETFQFVVVDNRSEMEVNVWQSTLDILTNVESMQKSGTAFVDLDLSSFATSRDGRDYSKDVGKKSRSLASLGFHVRFIPSPNKFETFQQYLLDDNNHLLRAIFETYQSSDSSNISKSLIYFYAYNGRLPQLYKLAVQLELESAAASAESDESAGQPTQLFRGTTLPVRILSDCLSLLGITYIQNVVSPLVKPLTQKVFDVELDPIKMSKPKDDKERKRSEKTLTGKGEKFLKAITSSYSILPATVREMCQYVATETEKKFPGKSNMALSGLLFLRFICPAIVAPENYGFSDIPMAVRRCLILVTKLLQNLANEVPFGEKESYMIPMNAFINSNTKKCSDFYKHVVNDKFQPAKWEDFYRRCPDWVYAGIFNYIAAEDRDEAIAKYIQSKNPEAANKFQTILIETRKIVPLPEEKISNGVREDKSGSPSSDRSATSTDEPRSDSKESKSQSGSQRPTPRTNE